MQVHRTSFPLFILPGGDQMTCARVRGSQRIRSNSERGIDQLTGIVGVTEDWHALLNYVTGTRY